MKKTMIVLVTDTRPATSMKERIEETLAFRFSHGSVHWLEYPLSTGSILESLRSIAVGMSGVVYIMAAPWATDYESIDEDVHRTVSDLQQKLDGVSFVAVNADAVIDDLGWSLERACMRAMLAYSRFVDTPAERIQPDSFRTIDARVKAWKDHPVKRSVLIRLIHTTADFSMEHDLVFGNGVVDDVLEALKSEKPIITDVRMVAAGIGTLFKERVSSAVAQEQAVVIAKQQGLTRSAAGIECLKSVLDGAVVAIGNAPTALMQCLRIAKRDGIRPACIIGCPVGFVGAAESKEELIRSGLPHIVLRGNRGGSSMAAAILNALGQYV